MITNPAFLLVFLLVAPFIFLAGYWYGRRPRRNLSCESVQVQNDDQHESVKKLESMMALMRAMTSEVGAHVGEHSERIVGITQTLESGGGSPDRVMAAGGLLISANRQLQSQLLEARAEIDRQKDELGRSIRDSLTDPLTGIPNRRAFDHELAQAFATFRRRSKDFALVMVDIDHFKRINDQNGHLVGDRVLKAFAKNLTSTFRETHFVARFGGEEFAVLLPRTPLHQAIEVAELARAATAACESFGSDVSLKITASLGVAEATSGDTEAALIKRADEALYTAKTAGRNQVFAHDGVSVKPGIDSGNPPQAIDGEQSFVVAVPALCH